MFVVEMINDILQNIYLFVPQELLIILLAGITIGVYESIKKWLKKE